MRSEDKKVRQYRSKSLWSEVSAQAVLCQANLLRSVASYILFPEERKESTEVIIPQDKKLIKQCFTRGTQALPRTL